METVSLQKKDQAPPPPEHIAIIMDGNGRWAEAQGLPRSVGHQRGASAVKNVLPTACWYEKDDLNTSDMHPFIHPLSTAVDPAWESKSDWDIYKGIAEKFSEVAKGVLGVEKDIVTLIEDAETMTAGNTRLTLTIALSYGARAEITAAARQIAEDVAAGTLAIGDIDETAIAKRLYTADMPDPDLLIRTSGEERINGSWPMPNWCLPRFCGLNFPANT